jgi:hypothetical protein
LRSERDVDAAYSQVAGITYNGTQDTYIELLTAVLNKLNIGEWRQLSISSTDISNKISNSCVGRRRVPMILLVNSQRRWAFCRLRRHQPVLARP